jgi:hypothetical protein
MSEGTAAAGAAGGGEGEGTGARGLMLTAVDLNAHVDAQLGLNAQNHPDLLPYTLISNAESQTKELHVERVWWEEDLLEETRIKIKAAASEHELKLIIQDELPTGGIQERNVNQPFRDLYRAV